MFQGSETVSNFGSMIINKDKVKKSELSSKEVLLNEYVVITTLIKHNLMTL